MYASGMGGASVLLSWSTMLTEGCVAGRSHCVHTPRTIPVTLRHLAFPHLPTFSVHFAWTLMTMGHLSFKLSKRGGYEKGPMKWLGLPV